MISVCSHTYICPFYSKAKQHKLIPRPLFPCFREQGCPHGYGFYLIFCLCYKGISSDQCQQKTFRSYQEGFNEVLLRTLMLKCKATYLPVAIHNLGIQPILHVIIYNIQMFRYGTCLEKQPFQSYILLKLHLPITKARSVYPLCGSNEAQLHGLDGQNQRLVSFLQFYDRFYLQ